jgi:hypothetical protein
MFNLLSYMLLVFNLLLQSRACLDELELHIHIVKMLLLIDMFYVLISQNAF